ncbi:MAG: peroxide stress protein YaaA [Nocardioidaceae bacterium]
MLVLLPPSEGKAAPARGKPLDLGGLALPGLTPVRERVLDELVTLCSGDADKASGVLGLGPTQAGAVSRNARLRTEPTARADSVYTGVLYAALDLPSLGPAARRRATRSLAIASALFGLVRPGDRIPAYRLSGDVSLPGIGPVAGLWRAGLAEVVPDLVGRGLLVDLRSQIYANLFRPTGELAGRTATIRVLHESGGRRQVVSHFNKATKGRIVRALLAEGAAPGSVDGLATALRDLGWVVERDDGRLDVIVTEV